MTPVAMLDWIDERADSTHVLAELLRGRRREPPAAHTTPTTEITTVEIVCAMTIATSASVTPMGAAMTMASSRSADEPAW